MVRAKPPLLLACLLLSLPLGAAAEHGAAGSSERGWLSELRGGVLAHDVGSLWSNSRKESGIDFSAEAIGCRVGLGVLWGTLRPNLGVTINDRGDTSKLYAGAVWEIRAFGVFFDLAGGGAVHDGRLETSDDDRKELGSRFLFRIGVDLGYEITPHHRLMVSFDHISNAGLASPNRGLDTLGARYGYRF